MQPTSPVRPFACRANGIPQLHEPRYIWAMPFAPGTSRTPSIVPSVVRSHGRGRWHVVWSLLLVIAAVGCSCLRPSATNDATQLAAWDQWKQTRLNSIAGTNGWATLVGLLWIGEGRQSLGSAPTAKLRLPTARAPLNAGDLIRSGTQVRFEAAPGVDAMLDGTAATSANLRSDANEAVPAVLQIGPLTLRILQRGERLAVRVKDPEASTRVHFRGLDYFPYASEWRISGQFEPAPPGRKLPITDVTGAIHEEACPGTIVFTVSGKPQRLDALDDDETHDLWLVFRDRTSGHSTYGGGRFLHVAKPGADRRVTIDFNFAYNPPCAFTPFATCPVPPRQNNLHVAIPAGERQYAGEHP